MDVVKKMGTVSGSLPVFVGIFAISYVALKAFGKSKKRLPPSIRALPILGSMPFLPDLAGLPRFFMETSKRLGPVFSFQIGSVNAVVLNTRTAIHDAFIKHSLSFAGRNAGYSIEHMVNPGLCGILAKQYGPSFRKYHQLTLNVLKEFGFGTTLIEERIMTEAEELVSLIKKQNGKPIYPARLFSMCTLNVVATIVFGQRLSQTDEKLNEYAKSIHEYTVSKRRYIDYFPALRFLSRFKKLIDQSIQISTDQLNFIRKRLDKCVTSSEDSFCKLFVERQGASCDYVETCYVMKDLLAAGSETTASSLQWATVLLANNREIQKRLQEEIDSVLIGSRPVSLDDLVNLPYVEAAISELTRIKTVVPLALQHCTIKDTETCGFFVPDKSVVLANLYGAHMNPKDWPEPEVYRPERFINEEGKVFGKDRIIPFSLGKRSCTGESLPVKNSSSCSPHWFNALIFCHQRDRTGLSAGKTLWSQCAPPNLKFA